MIYRILLFTLMLIWLPFSLPIMLIGVLARLSASSFWYGYEQTDTILAYVFKRGYMTKQSGGMG